jgi:protease I
VGRVLMVVAPERFRDEELFDTRTVLEASGHAVVVASTRVGECPGSRGGHVLVEAEITDQGAADFDAVVFVGGGGSKLLWRDEDAIRLAREAAADSKILGAICLAPVILANAGVLRGRRATVAGTEARTIEAEGATYTGPGVTVDGNIVTANGPKSSTLFGQSIADLLTPGGRSAEGPGRAQGSPRGARRPRRDTIGRSVAAMADKSTASSIDEYIERFPTQTQKVLQELRALIKASAPDAIETISYAIPTFDLNGHLVHFGGFAKHVGFYPTPRGLEAFADELKPYKGGKGSVQFPLDQPLPVDLIRRIVELRVEQNTRKLSK